MPAFTFTDLSACAPSPRVVLVAPGVWDVCFPAERALLPVSERRVRITAVQVVALTRLATEDAGR